MRFGRQGLAAPVLGAVLLTAVGCASGGSTRSERNDAQRYLRLGQMQLDQGKTSQAIESMRKAIDQDPRMVEAYNFLGLIYLTNSEFDRAIEQFEEAVKIDPYFTDARNNLGIACRRVGQLDRAEEEFQAALKDGNYRSPEKIHLNLGHLYLEQNRHGEAIESFQRAVEIAPEYLLGLMGLGQAYIAAGQVDQAETALNKVIRIAPDSPEAERARQMITGQAKRDDR
ncbi:MAG TPA: tetratricopeptide repeat protein [Candidatus Polarisedimenticolia bacterium]|nr:tetratricopeptide repeat protein [Candidatus Polarisedimenticolia bacterium]